MSNTAVSAKTFDDWWAKDGRLLDPEPSVAWYDKRRDFAEMVWRAARERGPVMDESNMVAGQRRRRAREAATIQSPQKP